MKLELGNIEAKDVAEMVGSRQRPFRGLPEDLWDHPKLVLLVVCFLLSFFCFLVWMFFNLFFFS